MAQNDYLDKSGVDTSTPVTLVRCQPDLTPRLPELKEAEGSCDAELEAGLLDCSGSPKRGLSGAIHTSTPVKVNTGVPSVTSLALTPSFINEPSVSVDGINQVKTIKNQNTTLSVTVSNDTTQPTTPHLQIPTENSIYSRMDEFRVPVIVNWSNGSVPSATTPSLLSNDASPFHGPEIMPQFTGVSVDVIDTLLTELKAFLPVPWRPADREEEVCAFVFDTLPKDAVLRAVSVQYEQGSVRISVHGGIPLPENHSIWNEIGPNFPLSKDNVQAFSKRIVRIVTAVCQLKICPGVEATEKATKILASKKNIIFDRKFGDVNGPCYRPSDCSLLISSRSKICASCFSLARNLNRRGTQKKDETEGIPKTPCSHTRHDYLTESASKRLLKKKQQKIKLQQQTIVRLRERITKLLDTEGIYIDKQLSKDLKMVLKEGKLSDVQKIFLQQQVRCSQVKSSNGMRWHPLMIRFALHLKSISPAAFEAVRQSGVIKLPSSSTLVDYSSVYTPESGSNSKIIEDAANRVNKLVSEHPYQRFHSLLFDEMGTSQNLVYSSSTGELIGYAHLSKVTVEMNEMQKLLEGNKELSEHPPIANHMLTYMIKGTASGVKEAVASYPTANLTKEQLYERTWDVIGNLEMAGIAVVALVSDGAAVNRAFYQMHVPITKNDNGIVFDTINFCSGDARPLYFFSDVPHLLKCIRNNFMASGKGKGKTRCLIKNGQTIVWDTIVSMFNAERDETWSRGFKLNQQNVFPDSYSRMRVPLAAQVMSDTVSKLIPAMNYKDCEETAIFIKKVNDFFDMLNGAHSQQARRKRNKNLDRYVSPFDERFGQLLDFLKYLKEWKEEARAATAHLKKKEEECAARQLSWQTLEGIERTIHAFIGCTRYLLRSGQQFVMARVFCQDPLEQYFSHQRSLNGGNRNPNPLAFLKNQNTIHLLHETGFNRKRGNTETLSIEEMSTTSTPLKRKPKLSAKRSIAEKHPYLFSTELLSQRCSDDSIN